jgi:uncharacterized integral membrane protein
MGNLWLKIKVWTKGILGLLVLLYALFFAYNNSDPTTVWLWFGHQPTYSKLVLLAIAFFAGVICTILVRTTMRTLRQIRELQSKSRTDRIERELADMKQKASRLQTKPIASSSTDISASSNEPIE